MTKTEKQDLIREAVELFGIEPLADRIGSPQPLVEAWMKGIATMPDGKLARLAGALTELAGRR